MMCKTFSTTKAKDREALGEVITDWLRRTGADVLDTHVNQSSDCEFHCLSITIFYEQPVRR